MTTQSAAIPAFKQASAGPALTASLLVTLIAAVTIAGAWFFQLVLEILPCPLCLEQRYAYYLAIPLGALTALEDWRIAALTPDALDQKTVQLMAFAILLVQTSEAAANHAKAAIKAGATLEELHASAGIAALFRGVAAFNMAGEILAGLFPE